MSKHKKILLAGAVISGFLVLVTTIVTVSSIHKATRLHEDMQRSFTTLQSYFQRDPFPNPSNVAAEAEKSDLLRERYTVLHGALAKDVIVVEGRHSPGSFGKTCEDTINELRALAPKGETGASIVGPNFNFAFDRYDLSKNGAPAAAKDVPRLLRQLQMVDRLVRIFYKVELIKLEQVVREEFDSDSGGDRRPVSGRVGRRRGASTDATGVSLGSIESEPIEDAPFEIDRQRFGFVFIVREEGLFKLIDAVDSMWPFAQISSLDFQKTSGDVVFDRQEAAAVSDPKTVQPLPSKTSRIVSGTLREAPVRVAMTIDIYTLGAGDDPQESD